MGSEVVSKKRKRTLHNGRNSSVKAGICSDQSGTIDPLPVSASISDENGTENINVKSTSRVDGITVPVKTCDGDERPQRRKKENASARRKPISRENSTTFVESAIPWPELFLQLGQTHQALNLVYTFCCTRKHMSTTLDNLKSTVELQTKRTLTVDDVTQIRTLLPQSIHFAYVDEALLQVNLMGQEPRSRGGQGMGLPYMNDPTTDPKASNGECKEVLLFEYLDGDLKRQVRHAKTGEPTKATKKLRQEELKMPVYSQKQMMNLIAKRNMKFTSATNAFLNQCAEDGIDSTTKLMQDSRQYTPTLSVSKLPISAPNERSKLHASIPTERKSIPEIISEIRSLEWYTDQIVPDGHRVFDPQPPCYGELDFTLSQNTVNALYNTRNITQLYAHQAEAINSLAHGHNVIVSTSTSSGKSLIYQLPVLHKLEQDRNARAMYIFPTKALAQDQMRSIKELLRYYPGAENTVVETFDGDTPMEKRNSIRDEGRIILTNPDMLHINLLPQESSWRTFLQNLKYVVVDELHVYNGLFGAHVAFIMRRLRRICAAVGNRHIQFISCSATVTNPEQHMRTIFGVEDVKVVDIDGSPSGRKEFLCWNTPFKDPKDPRSGRGDAMAEAAKLFCQLILRGVRTIAFCKIRKHCEFLIGAVKTQMSVLERPGEMARVMGYRGGYTPQDRRKIEREMFDGKLMGIIATNALELGVDIGTLDAVITVGFPTSIANLRQQSGRAGRRNKDSLSVLLGDCFPVDQHYMNNPDEIFTEACSAVQVDLQNTFVLEGHLQCAAHEMPIQVASDIKYFGPQVEVLAKERLRRDMHGYFHCNERFLPHPSRLVAIRDTEEEHFAVIDTTRGANKLLEELEASRAFFTIYEGGIFLHQGTTYLVKDFSTTRMLAHVERVTVDWTTQQRDYTDVDPVATEAVRHIPGSPSRAYLGPIRVRQVVYGFFKLDRRRRILDAVEVDNPPIVRQVYGMWLDVPQLALEILAGHQLNAAAAIHAAEHTVLCLLPGMVPSQLGDVRTECKNALKEVVSAQRQERAGKQSGRKRPARLTFYDARGGAAGSGLSARAFDFIGTLLKRAVQRLDDCTCAAPGGCLACCCDPTCRQSNAVASKAGANVILRCLLGLPVDVDALPWGEDELLPAAAETVVAATEVPTARDRAIIG